MLNRFFTIVGVCALLFSSRMMLGQATQSATPASASSQTMSDADIQDMRADVREHRKKMTAANMTLTADEATKFWPIYDQYIQETIKVNDERWELIKKYATNYSTMTDELAQEYMSKSADVDQKMIALRLKYVPIFQNAVSVKKTAQWYQVDRRLDLLLNTQLGALIPVVNVTN